MTKTVPPDIFNISNTITIDMQPNADLILGTYYRMLTLAVKDPDGCVRVSPDHSMSMRSFAEFFNCPLSDVEKAVPMLQEMKMITVRDGTIQVNAFSVTDAQNNSQTDSSTGPAPLSVTKEETVSGHKTATYARSTMIPLENLPPVSQHILSCWNKLPLIKMKGLYPSLEKNLEYLLRTYTEEDFITAICIIKRSPFLLNKAENSTGWVITFKWMLEEDHLASILDGTYLDRNDPLKAKLQEARASI